MSRKPNPFLIKANKVADRWSGLKSDNSPLNKPLIEKKHSQINERFKIINENEEFYEKAESYEKKNIFQQSFKSEKPKYRESRGFMVFTNESKPVEKKPEINIEEMSESVFDNEFPTLG